MQSIEIKEDQKQPWNEFIAENKPESFLQTWQWGEFQKSVGKKIWRIAVMDDGKICALALLVKNNIPFLGGYFYCPRGPVVKNLKLKNQNSKKVWDILFSKIREIAKRENCFFLRMDPPIESSGELSNGFKKSPVEIQPKSTLMLDLIKPEGEILSGMKQKTRYNIRLAQKREVTTRISSNNDDFPRFWVLIEETFKRNEIISHPKEYYSRMLETLRENNESGKKLYSRLYLAEYNGKIVAANIVLFFGDLCIYLHGASSNANRNVMAPYLLQWRQIQDASKMGCKKYDFWGISLNGEKESWAGITRFKTGFGGNEKKYIGLMDLAFDNVKYQGYKAIERAREIF